MSKWTNIVQVGERLVVAVEQPSCPKEPDETSIEADRWGGQRSEARHQNGGENDCAEQARSTLAPKELTRSVRPRHISPVILELSRLETSLSVSDPDPPCDHCRYERHDDGGHCKPHYEGPAEGEIARGRNRRLYASGQNRHRGQKQTASKQ